MLGYLVWFSFQRTSPRNGTPITSACTALARTQPRATPDYRGLVMEFAESPGRTEQEWW